MERANPPVKEITIADLYPRLTPEEQAVAEENLSRYLEVSLRIFEQLEREGKLQQVLKEVREKSGRDATSRRKTSG